MKELTDAQMQIMKAMIRNQFEMLDLTGVNAVLNEDKIKDLIDLAKHYGFYDLVAEMASDYVNEITK